MKYCFIYIYIYYASPQLNCFFFSSYLISRNYQQVKSCTEDEARVQYLDVGKMENVKLENLKPLIAKFGEADRLAVACSLHGIKPVAGSCFDLNLINLYKINVVAFSAVANLVTLG